MMGSMGSVLAHTPWYVWVILAVLFALGIFHSHARTCPLLRLALPPIVMAVISQLGMYLAFGVSALGFAAWIVGVGIAVVLNETLILARGARYAADTRTFDIRGSWTPLGVMLAIFCTWYAFTVVKFFHPDVPYRLSWIVGVGLVQGFLSGIFIGSFVRLYRIARAHRSITC